MSGQIRALAFQARGPELNFHNPCTGERRELTTKLSSDLQILAGTRLPALKLMYHVHTCSCNNKPVVNAGCGPLSLPTIDLETL